jgi:hypothetical protein
MSLKGEVLWVWEPEMPELPAHNLLQCVVEDYTLDGVMCYIDDYYHYVPKVGYTIDFEHS